METRIEDPSQLYFSSAEYTANWLKYLSESSGEGMKWGTPLMNSRILPLGVAKMGSITALPGAGKTSLAVALSRDYAKEIHNAGIKDKGVLYITVDQTVEDITSFFMASKEHTVTDFAEGKVSRAEAIALATNFVGTMPVYIFGKSAVERRVAPRLTYHNIELGIEEMGKRLKLSPALIVIDYVQNMPIEGNKKRIEQVSEAVIRARELCLDLACPLLLCVQASRESRERDIKIPVPQDNQWSSAIEQEMDVMLGIWKPRLTELDKTHVEYGGHKIPITDDLLFAGLVKQRRKPAGFVFVLNFNGGSLELSDMEFRI